jgi:hypothetical protein
MERNELLNSLTPEEREDWELMTPQEKDQMLSAAPEEGEGFLNNPVSYLGDAVSDTWNNIFPDSLSEQELEAKKLAQAKEQEARRLGKGGGDVSNPNFIQDVEASNKLKDLRVVGKEGDNLEENSPLGDIGEKLKNAYDSINNTLSLSTLSALLRNKGDNPVFLAWLKKRGLPMDEYIIKGVLDTVKDAETSIREGIIKPANAVVDANEVVGNKIGEVVGNMKDDKSRSTLSQFMGAGPKGYDWLTDPFTDKDPTGEDLESSYTAGTTGEVSQGLMNTKKDKKKDKKKDVLEKKAEKIFSPHPLDEKKGDPLMNISKETEGYKNKDFEDEDVSSSLKAVQNAKTEAEKEKALPKDKDKRAAVKEQADRYWIDPRTGFALNLTEMDKRMDRKSEMAMAALFPAGDRAAYLYGKKLIDKEDYEMMIKPSEKEEAATLLSKVKRKETILKIKKLEQDSKKNPQEKNWIDLFKNAVTNDNYIMQEILGRKLGFSDSDLKKSRDLSKSQELAKLAGSGKAFKTQFDVEYSTVIGNKAKWQSRSSSVVYGSQDEEFDLGGFGGKPSKFTDRRGYFKSYGLYEQADAQSMDRSRLNGILMKAPMARTFTADPRYEGSDGKFDAIKFVNDTDAYERYLYDTLVFEGMSSLYQPKIYAAMMKYQAKNTKKGTFAKKLTNNNR